MPSGLSAYLQNKTLDAIFRGQSLPTISTVYFALILDPSQGGNEVTGGGYTRASVATSLSNFCGTQGSGTTTASSGTSGQVSNNVNIVFPSPSAYWGLVDQVWVYDSASGGNILAKGMLTSQKNINGSDPAPLFPPGAITFTFSNTP